MPADKLKDLYREIAGMTAPLCAGKGKGACRSPHSCCEAMYCHISIEYTKEIYGVDLIPLEGTKLPFMGPNGCILEPHYRPMCSVHVCCINSIGANVHDMEWTEKYFKLREEIDLLEYEMGNTNV